jgi:hypothetical protein
MPIGLRETTEIDTSMAITSLNDPNIVSVLSPIELSLLLEYIQAQARLDYTLAVQKDHLLQLNSDDKERLSQAIADNALAAAKICDALQNEFQIYYHPAQYDQEKVQSIREYIVQREDHYREKYGIPAKE